VAKTAKRNPKNKGSPGLHTAGNTPNKSNTLKNTDRRRYNKNRTFLPLRQGFCVGFNQLSKIYRLICKSIQLYPKTFAL